MRRCSINNQTEKFKISSDLCFCFSFVCLFSFLLTLRQLHNYEYVYGTVFCNSFYNFVLFLFFCFLIKSHIDMYFLLHLDLVFRHFQTHERKNKLRLCNN